MKAVVIHAAKDLRVEERALEPLGSGQVEVAIEAGGHYYIMVGSVQSGFASR